MKISNKQCNIIKKDIKDWLKSDKEEYIVRTNFIAKVFLEIDEMGDSPFFDLSTAHSGSYDRTGYIHVVLHIYLNEDMSIKELDYVVDDVPSFLISDYIYQKNWIKTFKHKDFQDFQDFIDEDEL